MNEGIEGINEVTCCCFLAELGAVFEGPECTRTNQGLGWNCKQSNKKVGRRIYMSQEGG